VQFFSSLAQLPADFGPTAVTIGKFDGMHAGHRAVVAALKLAAAEAGLVSAVLTFDKNPLALLHPESCPLSLMSNIQKQEALDAAGLDAEVEIEFTHAFANLTARQFVHNVLIDSLHARLILVGHDFRFGHGGEGTVALLTELGEEFGFVVQELEQVKPDGERVVSSSWVRDLLKEGNVERAAELLGHRPAVRAIVVRGEQRGRELGYPTANLAEKSEGYIPADGVYAAFAQIEGKTYPAAVSIGSNPTFEGVRAKQVEAHILDETLDLYGLTIEVSFVKYMRGMVKYDGVDALVAQMRVDEQQIRAVLGLVAPQGTAL
jgi:riboflavin kinase/FMN adenylyltransferase